MSFNSELYDFVGRGIFWAIVSALVALTGCKSAPEQTPDTPDGAITQCVTPDASDPYTVITQWAALSPDAQQMSDPARTLRDAWPTLYVVRAWRVDASHWMALLGDSPEPAPDAQVIMISATREASGSWAVKDPAQVTRADVLWPQL